ncbi:beta-1,4-galactosyltransferase 1-like isoform X2 [Thalassophryne amazonica]|uniref:beta-1,4-galactosyltransferase 1-like isoform X2 n=1 Tax=Thalassophryne amazonica TaxID=390379 RepID=UPI001470DBBD|nr:beta-1,4-galactosyltransferase 1-like isoform X2 [Thalassophryne amazonica]
MARGTHSSFHLLNRMCMVVVLLCFLHICISLVFYIRSMDIKFTFVQNQQSNNGMHASWIGHISSSASNHNQNVLSIQDDKQVEVNKDQQDDLQASPVHPEKHSGGTKSKHLEKCPETSPLLVGPLWVEFDIQVSLEKIKKENPNVLMGGRYRPKDCMALQKVAIIIPFRNRNEHLKYWLYYLHPILQRQQMDYGVFIINQDGDGAFNRAKLLNIGYVEALKQYDYDCFIFSDIDIIPMDDRNLYKCFGGPRHLSVLVDTLDFRGSWTAGTTPPLPVEAPEQWRFALEKQETQGCTWCLRWFAKCTSPECPLPRSAMGLEELPADDEHTGEPAITILEELTSFKTRGVCALSEPSSSGLKDVRSYGK